MSSINKNRLSAIGAFLLAISIALGAFGAHALRGLINPETLETYKTAIQYAQLHALALVFLPLLKGAFSPTLILKTWRLILLGMILFSGSLIAVVLGRAYGISLDKAGIITPFGGLTWIISWCMLGWHLLRKR